MVFSQGTAFKGRDVAYDDLYRAHALDGSLFYTVPVKKAALIIALDNDVRDQREVEADLPNDGDYAVWMSPELEPLGKVRASRDSFEKALSRGIDGGRIKCAVIARKLDDKIDPIHTRLHLHQIESWCRERDIELGYWWQQYSELEFEFAGETIDEIARHFAPSPLHPEEFDVDAFARYKESEAVQQEQQYRSLLQEVHRLKQGGAKPSSREETDRSINTKEKNSLLTVLASLVEALSDRLPQPEYKRAQAISQMTERIGAPVSTNTVDKFLKETTDAVEKRKQAYR